MNRQHANMIIALAGVSFTLPSCGLDLAAPAPSPSDRVQGLDFVSSEDLLPALEGLDDLLTEEEGDQGEPDVVSGGVLSFLVLDLTDYFMEQVAIHDERLHTMVYESLLVKREDLVRRGLAYTAAWCKLACEEAWRSVELRREATWLVLWEVHEQGGVSPNDLTYQQRREVERWNRQRYPDPIETPWLPDWCEGRHSNGC